MNARIFLSPPWMGGGEQEQVREAFASNYVAPTGPMVDRFEALFSERVGIPNVCALSSGTAGLDLLFRELGVGRGDTVICSDLTFVASIAPAVHAGAETNVTVSGLANDTVYHIRVFEYGGAGTTIASFPSIMSQLKSFTLTTWFR